MRHINRVDSSIAATGREKAMGDNVHQIHDLYQLTALSTHLSEEEVANDGHQLIIHLLGPLAKPGVLAASRRPM